MTIVASADTVQATLISDTRVLVLSPHLDDAVLSCGGLLASLGERVDVATAFTEAGPTPHTRAARTFLRQCAATDAHDLYERRRDEDRAVLAEVGARAHHLGHTDALFRRRHCTIPGATAAGRALPELVHRYPTYRFDIALGRRSRGDDTLVGVLRAQVEELRRSTGAGLVLCPLGVGRHVDHLIVRDLGALFPGRVAYYSDFPYDRVSGPDVTFVAQQRLRSWLFSDGVETKERLIRGYRTQVDALFPDTIIPLVPDTLYVADS